MTAALPDALLLAESYVHRLDPFALRLGSGFGVRWYGLAYMVGFVVGWLALRRAGTRGAIPGFDRVAASDLILPVILGVVVGGRVGYAVFYDPSLLTGFTSSFPFWDLLALWKGGMASHGGVLGVIVAIVLFARSRESWPTAILDVTAWIAPIGLMCGRIANFINGELWGRAYPDQATPPAWTVKYPEEILLAGAERAEQARAALVDVVLPKMLADETVLGAAVRLAREGDAAVTEALAPFLTAYWPSQLVQALAEGPVLFGVLTLAWLRPRKPGVIGSSFLVTYAVLRIATEFVRQPDAGVATLAGLSRGQVLSLAMLAISIGLLVWTLRRDRPRISGMFGPVVPAEDARRADRAGDQPSPGGSS